MIVRCEGQVDWTAFLDAASGRWIGVCPALNLAAEGETWSELQAEANDALVQLMHELLEAGELAQFLSAHGWRAEVPPDVRASDVVIDIPAPFIIRSQQQGERIACD